MNRNFVYAKISCRYSPATVVVESERTGEFIMMMNKKGMNERRWKKNFPSIKSAREGEEEGKKPVLCLH